MKRWWMGLLALPLLMVLAMLTGLAFWGGSEPGLEQLARLAVRSSAGVLTIDQVTGRLLGNWRLEGVRIQTVDLDLRLSVMEGRLRPLALLRGEAQMSLVRGQGVDLLIKEDPLDTSPLILPSLNFPLPLALDRVEIEDFFIHDDSGVEFPNIEWIAGRLAAKNRRAHLEGGEYRMNGVTAQVQGTMDFEGKWPVDLRGGISIEVGKGAVPLSADFVIGAVLTDPVAEIDLTTPASTRINVSCTDLFGDLRWAGETTVARVSAHEILSLWQAEMAGADPAWPEPFFTEAHLTATGTTDGYTGKVRMQGQWTKSAAWPHLAALPPMTIEAELAGDTEGLQVPSLMVKSETGELRAQGMVNWLDDVHWQAELVSRELALAPYVPGWTGSMDARIKTSGRLAGDVLSGELELVALDGDLLGYPLSGTAQLRLDEVGLRVDSLRLRSGESELDVSGTVGEKMNLEVRAEVASLANLWPEAAGTGHFQGRVGGTWKVPEFTFALDGTALAYREAMMQTVSGSGRLVFTAQGDVEVKLTGQGLRAASLPFSSVELGLTGSMARHHLQAKLAGASAEMDMAVDGGLEMAGAVTWKGELGELLLHLDPYGRWRLTKPAPLRVDGNGVELAPVCLEQGAASLCVEGDWRAADEGQWRLHADLDSFACGLLHQWHLLPRPLEGVLSGQLRVQGLGSRLIQGEADLTVPDLEMTVPDEDGRKQKLRWTETQLRLKLADSRLSATARSLHQGGSTIDAGIQMDGFGDLAGSWDDLPLQGKIDLDVKDLTPFAFIADSIFIPTGSVKGAFTLSGRLGSPSLTGELRQRDGTVFLPAAGITLEELYLSVTMRGEGEGMAVVLTADSGPGRVRVDGTVLRRDDTWRMDLHVTGKEFEVAHLTEYEIVVDPDLHILMDAGVARVTGRVLVPRAVIAVNKMNGYISSSDDVIIVDDVDGGKKEWPLSGTVTVELGKDVRVDSFGVKGRMEGSVAVTAAPGHPLTGKGTLIVHDGIYVVRNRALDISRGKFFFLGGPLVNPGIDVLAQKKNNSRTVGVLVSGTVDDMEVKLFSDPPMGESEILTALLSGRPYAENDHQMSKTVEDAVAGVGLEKGGAILGDILSGFENQFLLDNIYMESGEEASDVSVMIGKELFKDMYISYGYDPFKASGVFKARYDLWKRFSVETEIGAEQTGADLLWSIEK